MHQMIDGSTPFSYCEPSSRVCVQCCVKRKVGGSAEWLRFSRLLTSREIATLIKEKSILNILHPPDNLQQNHKEDTYKRSYFIWREVRRDSFLELCIRRDPH